MLAVTNYMSPLLWAVIVGWILSVVLHEFAHGLVGYLGGDYTVRQRGGLSLNPLQYINPVTTIALPVLFVLMGGIPLPGGATYIRRDLLRTRYWASAVSLAGPATNFLIFLALALPFHPTIGWIQLSPDPAQWTDLELFMGASAFLQLFSVFLNLLPIPPLDGFGAIAPFLPADLRARLQNPRTFMIGLFAVYLLLQSQMAREVMHNLLFGCLSHLRFDEESQEFLRRSFNKVLFSVAD